MKTFSGPPPPSPIISREWGWTAWGFVWQEPFNSKTANSSMSQPGLCSLLADFEAAVWDLWVPEGSRFFSLNCLLPSAGQIKLEWARWCSPSFWRKLQLFLSAASWGVFRGCPRGSVSRRTSPGGPQTERASVPAKELRQTWLAADSHSGTQRWIFISPHRRRQEASQTIIPQLIFHPSYSCASVSGASYYSPPSPISHQPPWHSFIHTNGLHKTPITNTIIYEFFFGQQFHWKGYQ